MLRPYRTFVVVPSLPPRLAPLGELAYNLWWSWNMEAVDLFRRLDRDLWESTGHNPVLILGRISQDRLEEVAADEGFVSHMMRVYQSLNRYMSSDDTWFNRQYAEKATGLRIAYFSAEFGISECLPNYSGGLGVLAGDHLKSASDLGLPLVGVGLLYQEGYFRQYLNADGWQQESYPINDFHTMPIRQERGRDGSPVTIRVEFPGRDVVAQIWHVQVGRVPLYLLDTNVEANRPEDRDITDRLYGGDLDMRIRQELILGIGGIRALKALGIEPSVCHINEGHSAFLGLERIRLLMQEKQVPFAVAREATSAGNVFTTHTPVPAGIDLFPPYLMDRYFGNYYGQLGLSRDEFLSLGRPLEHGPDSNFSMAILALRLAANTNGVSKLHGQVARKMWRDLWPQTPVQEVPITSVTNGIHPRSWLSGDMSDLLLRYFGPRWIERPWEQSMWARIDRIPDEELWRTHQRRRERLVAVARERLRKQMEQRGATPQELSDATNVLHPDVLTIGFARRFATYKRALLLFSDPERLARILNNPDRPVQIIFAGKAHPHDNPGKEFIRQLVHFARREEFRRRVIFIEDYDMVLGRYLVQGVDVWLNTPRHGQEASGTSGMKAAANGGINLSTFDGWWCEGYSPETGWSIGQGETYADDRYGDEVEAKALYDLLEKDVIPLFYERTAGLPRNWIAKMRASMSKITPVFNAHRMVQEYADRFYLPASSRHAKLSAEDLQASRELVAWLERVRARWHGLNIVHIESDARDETPVKTEIAVTARIQLGELTPEDILVQIYHGRVDAQGQIADYSVVDMTPGDKNEHGEYVYSGTLCCPKTGLHGYDLRILPNHPDLSNPNIPGLVIWSS